MRRVLRMTAVLQAIGDLLTIGGLALAIGAVVYESRARGIQAFPRAVVQAARWTAARVRRRGQPEPQVIKGGTAHDGRDTEAYAIVRWPQPVHPDDPVEQQIQALVHNLADTEKYVLDIARQEQKLLREALQARVKDLTQGLRDLRQEQARSSQYERDIAEPRVKVELTGLVAAMVGALLSAISRLASYAGPVGAFQRQSACCPLRRPRRSTITRP